MSWWLAPVSDGVPPTAGLVRSNLGVALGCFLEYRFQSLDVGVVLSSPNHPENRAEQPIPATGFHVRFEGELRAGREFLADVAAGPFEGSRIERPPGSLAVNEVKHSPFCDHLAAVGLDPIETSSADSWRVIRREGGLDYACAPLGVVRYVHHEFEDFVRWSIDNGGGRDVHNRSPFSLGLVRSAEGARLKPYTCERAPRERLVPGANGQYQRPTAGRASKSVVGCCVGGLFPAKESETKNRPDAARRTFSD